MKIHTLFGAAFVFVASSQRPDIYLIRHGEKNPDGTISTKGMARARCLETVFRKDSGYNIQKMMAQKVWSGRKLYSKYMCLFFYQQAFCFSITVLKNKTYIPVMKLTSCSIYRKPTRPPQPAPVQHYPASRSIPESDY